MGGQEAFAKVEATCTTWEATWLLLECASTQLDNMDSTWEAKRLLAASSLFGLQDAGIWEW